MAVDQYKQLYNAYPPDRSIPPFGLHADLDQSSECLVYFLSGASICYDSSTYPDYRWAHSLFDLNRLGAGRDVKIVFYTFRWNTLTDADDDRIPEVVDAWGTPLLYNVSSPTHNRGKFDLSSAGPDKRFGTKDDIENWDD